MKAILTGLLVFALTCAGIAPIHSFRAWGPTAAFAQTDDVSAAQSLYDQGQYAQAATTIREGLSSGRIFGNRVVSARELLARCQVKMGQAANAKRTFLSILAQDPLYRPDALRVPPDEMAVFNQAKAQFDAGQQRAAQRLPASIELHAGIGSGENKDIGDFVASGGGSNKFDNKAHLGGIVRFALAPKFSMDFQIERFRATDSDKTLGIEYVITAIPVGVSLVYLVHDGDRARGYVFAGGGPMLEATTALKLPTAFFGAPIQFADTKVGTYLQAGIEGEYRLHPRFSVTGRLLGRYAKTPGLFKDSNLYYVSSTLLDDRAIDFSGFAATIGLRAYVGY